MYVKKPSRASRLFKPYKQLPVVKFQNHWQPKLMIQLKQIIEQSNKVKLKHMLKTVFFKTIYKHCIYIYENIFIQVVTVET